MLRWGFDPAGSVAAGNAQTQLWADSHHRHHVAFLNAGLSNINLAAGSHMPSHSSTGKLSKAELLKPYRRSSNEIIASPGSSCES
jgi:hypothetical protein